MESKHETLITDYSELVNLNIPEAETAKIAIVRPTEHFQVVSEDNPDMIRTLAALRAKIDLELASTACNGLTASEKDTRKKELVKKFQKELSEKASKEQQNLIETMKQHGILIHILVEDKTTVRNQTEFDYYTDQIFATDVGQFYDKNGTLCFIPARFKNDQRFGEERLAIIQAENIGATIQKLPSNDKKEEYLTFEGGDIRQMPGRRLFFIGQGHRTTATLSELIADLSGYYVIPVVLKKEQFYHIDCCFLPLPGDVAVVYEGVYKLDSAGQIILDENGWPSLQPDTETMDDLGRKMIRTLYPDDKLITISKAEALAFATNAAILQDLTTKKFKLFVNGDPGLSEKMSETDALQQHLISFTRETLERIRNATNDFLEIIQVPFSTIQKSGGSVRCTVQEVACSESACKPNLQKPYYFSERIEQFENQHLLSGISLFRPKISPSFDSLNPQEHAAHEYR